MFENMSVRETELNQVIIVDKIPDLLLFAITASET